MDEESAEQFLDRFFGCVRANATGNMAYLDSAVAQFIHDHPAADGWLVYSIMSPYECIALSDLPAFLRLRGTGLKWQEAKWISFGWNEGSYTKRLVCAAPPHRRRGAGAADRDWFGEIHLTWRSVPIHIQRRSLHDSDRDKSLTLIATREHAALEDLLNRLLKFRRAFARGKRTIWVINADIYLPIQDLGWKDLILPPAMVLDIRSSVESFLGGRASYKAMGLPYRRGFLLAGPPGCGKTTAVRVIARQSGVPILTLRLTEELHDCDLERAFRCASSNAPAVLVLEDLDRLVGSRNISMAYLLGLLDGVEAYSGFLIVATSNRPEKLDPALLHRPSRFDRVWHFGLPELDARRTMLLRRGQGKFSEHAVEEAARRTEGFTLAYVQEAAVSALLQGIYEKREPRDKDLLDSVDRLRSQFKTSSKASGSCQPSGTIGFETKMNGRLARVNGAVAGESEQAEV